ncbi:aldo-keto reductase-like [Pyrus ussuriensis x Pyrus communis]|uniref:Aldo-keto reductase-like n=1 Tax=Pyrus ussuriensis x Pyrus communis TaxID=2448454 RepID=A0A5N5GZH7_9ROSA|nr:aldo-keto reductase-like [Pyrus ussuriensis x Pyrus communis]
MAVPLVNLAPNLTVSKLCLGTTTFGEQNSLPESFRLLGGAVEAGINFFDSAEMYPVVQRAETQGTSEEYLGRWIRESKTPRNSVVLATKVTGPSGQMTWVRDGPKCLDAGNIADAIDGSLRRLQTDYIDLYQIHWPDRFVCRHIFVVVCKISAKFNYVPMFWETECDPTRQFCSIPMKEQLDSLGRAVDSGKIRYVGLSNETPYGVMKFVQVAERSTCRPKIVSLQVVYLMEFILSLKWISLLAYSPLAMGILSRKYFSHDEGPADAQLNVFRGKYSEGESRYNLSNHIIRAAAMSLHPVSLAIAFVLSRPLVASVIFGATKSWQLQEVLDGCKVELTPEVIAEINKVHKRFPNPCP